MPSLVSVASPARAWTESFLRGHWLFSAILDIYSQFMVVYPGKFQKKKTKRKVQKKKRNWLHNSSMLMGPTSCTQPTHNICVFCPTTQFWGIRLIFHLARQNSFHANLAPRFAPDLTSNLKASPKPQSQVPPWLLLQLWPHVYGAKIRSGIMGNCRSFLALSTFLGGPFVEIFTMVHNGIIKADQKWRKLAANCTTKGPKAATFGRRI